jgi:hypothetical protein
MNNVPDENSYISFLLQAPTPSPHIAIFKSSVCFMGVGEGTTEARAPHFSKGGHKCG